MTTIRQELETKLAAFAAAQTPPLAVSYEGVPFTKPTGVPWLECFLVSASTVSTAMDASRNRERGSFVVNSWVPSGQGAAKVDALAAQIVSLYKVVPKTGNVSIERPGNTSKILLDIAGWLVVSATFPYRVESVA